MMSTASALCALQLSDRDVQQRTQKTPTIESHEQSETKHLFHRLGLDAMSALTAAVTVSPVMTMIDRFVDDPLRFL